MPPRRPPRADLPPIVLPPLATKGPHEAKTPRGRRRTEPEDALLTRHDVARSADAVAALPGHAATDATPDATPDATTEHALPDMPDDRPTALPPELTDPFPARRSDVPPRRAWLDQMADRADGDAIAEPVDALPSATAADSRAVPRSVDTVGTPVSVPSAPPAGWLVRAGRRVHAGMQALADWVAAWPWTRLVALLCASMSAYMSSDGLMQLFPGAGVTVLFLVLAFEGGKIQAVLTSMDTRVRAWLRTILIGVAICLVGVNTVGIYSYLSNAYMVGRVSNVELDAIRGSAQEEVNALGKDQERTYALIEALPAAQGRNRNRALVQLQPKLDSIAAKLSAKRADLARLKAGSAVADTKAGQLKYAAAALRMTPDTLARVLITVLAVILDPMAVFLWLASQQQARADAAERTRAAGAATLR